MVNKTDAIEIITYAEENGINIWVDMVWKDTKGKIVDLHIFKFNEQGYIAFEGDPLKHVECVAQLISGTPKQ